MRSASKSISAGSNNNNLSDQAPIKIEPKSAHTSDPFLQSFLSPTFDAAEYLNATLPPLQGAPSSLSSSLRSTTIGPDGTPLPPAPLAELSTETQTLITQLNAHTTRLTGTLTQLAEDILRSGSRLAYEVELLRGETLSLSEALSEGPLRADLERFAPNGVMSSGTPAETSANGTRRPSIVSNGATPGLDRERDTLSALPTPAAAPIPGAIADGADGNAGAEGVEQEPPYISHLRTLTLVRSRLDAVIKTFGEAMEFVFPPSEISVSSGFLSVSAPDFPDRHSSSAEQISMEDRGQQVLRKIRDEVASLLKSGSGPGGTYQERIKGIEDATKRVDEIKTLSVVWKGTAEEKGRQKFVEGLSRMVEDRHREVLREAESQREQQQQQARNRSDSAASKRDQGNAAVDTTTTESRGPLGGYGFMNQWQKIRGGL